MIPIDRGGGGYQGINEFRRSGFVAQKKYFSPKSTAAISGGTAQPPCTRNQSARIGIHNLYLSRGTSFGAGRRWTRKNCSGLTAARAARRSSSVGLAPGLRIGRRRANPSSGVRKRCVARRSSGRRMETRDAGPRATLSRRAESLRRAKSGEDRLCDRARLSGSVFSESILQQ